MIWQVSRSMIAGGVAYGLFMGSLLPFSDSVVVGLVLAMIGDTALKLCWRFSILRNMRQRREKHF